MGEQPVLRGARVVLSPAGDPQLGAILEVLLDPTVVRWWGHYDSDRVREEYADPKDEVVYLVEVAGDVAGIIQYGEEDDPDYRHASIDIALKAPAQGTGVGPEAIRVVLRHLFGERGHHRITIDPAAENRNAIRAYEKVGFRPVGIMRQFERGEDGAWHDNLLMDLLRSEFVDG